MEMGGGMSAIGNEVQAMMSGRRKRRMAELFGV